MSTTNQAEKYLINCQEGLNHPERATISFILAVTASKTAETAVFITSDATNLMVQGVASEVQADGYEPLEGLINTFVENGGKIWLCPACAKAKSLQASDLRAGVEIAGAPKTMAFLQSGAKLLA